MRIYLAKNYREVCAGSPKVYRVQQDLTATPVRYFIEAGATEENVLRTLQMLEEQKVATPPPPPVPEVKKEAAPPPPTLPDSYFCEQHKREHKRGSSQFAACFSKNFKSSEP